MKLRLQQENIVEDYKLINNVPSKPYIEVSENSNIIGYARLSPNGNKKFTFDNLYVYDNLLPDIDYYFAITGGIAKFDNNFNMIKSVVSNDSFCYGVIVTDDSVYLLNSDNLTKYDLDLMVKWILPLFVPIDIKFAHNNIFVADYNNLKQISADGTIIKEVVATRKFSSITLATNNLRIVCGIEDTAISTYDSTLYRIKNLNIKGEHISNIFCREKNSDIYYVNILNGEKILKYDFFENNYSIFNAKHLFNSYVESAICKENSLVVGLWGSKTDIVNTDFNFSKYQTLFKPNFANGSRIFNFKFNSIKQLFSTSYDYIVVLDDNNNVLLEKKIEGLKPKFDFKGSIS